MIYQEDGKSLIYESQDAQPVISLDYIDLIQLAYCALVNIGYSHEQAVIIVNKQIKFT